MGDLSSRLSGLGDVGWSFGYLLPVIGLVVLLIVFYIVMAMVKKAKKGSHDITAGLTYLDVTGMKKQGLLTDEETARIRAAMSRQVERQRAGPSIKAPVSLVGEHALMADPEVQRLQAMAEQRTRERATGQNTAPPAIPSSVPVAAPPASKLPPDVPITSGEPNYGDPIPADFAPAAPSPELDSSAWTRIPLSSTIESRGTEEDDVPLPPDVLKMAELGLITPEELARIKTRIRDKKREL